MELSQNEHCNKSADNRDENHSKKVQTPGVFPPLPCALSVKERQMYCIWFVLLHTNNSGIWEVVTNLSVVLEHPSLISYGGINESWVKKGSCRLPFLLGPGGMGWWLKGPKLLLSMWNHGVLSLSCMFLLNTARRSKINTHIHKYGLEDSPAVMVPDCLGPDSSLISSTTVSTKYHHINTPDGLIYNQDLSSIKSSDPDSTTNLAGKNHLGVPSLLSSSS